MTKIFSFSAVLFLFCFVSRAEFTQFDFSLGRYLVEDRKDIEVNFNFDLSDYSQKDFLVAPLIKNGMVEIFNFEKNSWVSYGDPIYDMPYLESKMIIRISGFEVEKTSLNFQIFNLKTGEIYMTPEKNIWSKKIYSDYLQKFNDNLSANLSLKNENEDLPAESYNVALIGKSNENLDFFEKINEVPNKYLFFPVPLMFVFSVLAGFKFGLKNKAERKNLDVKTKTYVVDDKIH